MARDFWSLQRNVVAGDDQSGPLKGLDGDDKFQKPFKNVSGKNDLRSMKPRTRCVEFKRSAEHGTERGASVALCLGFYQKQD